MAGMTALPLQQFIATLDSSCLPKILQVCSGVYFQGSVYEISGSEVCFSTGDLIKVTAMELISVCCEDISKNEKFELPLNHSGLFKVVPEAMAYNTVEEMVKLRPVSVHSGLPFNFTCGSKMSLDNFTVGAGQALTMLSIEQSQGNEGQLRCQVLGHQETSAEVYVPLSTRGEFYVCDSEECFTLKEIMSSPCLRSQRFRLVNTTMCERPLVLSPVYQVHAVMNLRKNMLKFPSSLEVDVVDVTDICTDVNFTTPLSLTEVMSQPDELFPTVVEILEGPDNCGLFKSSWLTGLKKSSHLIFHKKGMTPSVLISSSKSRTAQQYFLVSQQYGGRFRRRQREFTSVYELYVASTNTPGLKVTVSKNCEEVEEEGIPALSVGEKLEIICCKKVKVPGGSTAGPKQRTEVLVCKHLQDPDDDDDDGDDDEEEDSDDEELNQEAPKEIYLPLYMQGHFVEILSENKKHKLKDLCKKFSLPLDVKVVSRDAELETDPLLRNPCLRIEGAMMEPTIQASFLQSPELCFEIPAQRLLLTVSFSKDPLPWPADQPPKCQVDTVTEVADKFFYEYRIQADPDATPPPRPPKRDLSKSLKKTSSETSKMKATKADKKPKSPSGETISTKGMADLSLDCKRKPPAPLPREILEADEPPPITPRKHCTGAEPAKKAQPNTYVKVKKSVKKASGPSVAEVEDSDHDYEDIEEHSLTSILKTAQDNAKYY